MSVPVLRMRGVRKGFGNVRVLEGVDLVVEDDELVALVGENGMGKTTVVRCVADGLSPDAGTVEVLGERLADGALPPLGAVEVVWQHLALCDNLDVVDNLFLGREPGWLLDRQADRQVAARALLDQLHVTVGDLTRPVATLSGGQRQSVALARALVTRPRLLVLDEPTAALDSAGVGAVGELIRRMRASGTAILLISHDLELVCQVADRVLVLRDGVITADVRRPNLGVEELRAHMSGLEADVHARRQLHGLRSLVDQLADVKPSAVLPLIVSAVSVALDQPRLALHLLAEDRDGRRRLHLAAGLGLGGRLRSALATIEVDGDGPQARSVGQRGPVVTTDLRGHGDPATAALLPLGVRSMWTVPLLGGNEVLGTLSAYGDAHGPVTDSALELASLYASHAAAALDRERLLTVVTRRNRTLETLRQVLETLAGPEVDDAGLRIAMQALQVGLGADGLVLLELDAGSGDRGDAGSGDPGNADRGDPGDADQVAGGKTVVRLAEGDDGGWARDVVLPAAGEAAALADAEGRAVLATTIADRHPRRALVARWRAGESPREGALELLTDGAHSMLLALERRAHEDARREAAALRRSTELQRRFLSRLSHELRTPLTAIHGYADTLRQPDVTWDHAMTRRFLDTIARESRRLGDLVTDLLDASAIEAGVLRLDLDWCAVAPVVEAAIACVPHADDHLVTADVDDAVPPVRADHDRIQQALVNLVGNAVHHTPPGTTITVRAAMADPDHLAVEVIDDGPGLPAEVAGAPFVPGVRSDVPSAGAGAGLGLSIAHGIVMAHGGRIEVATSSSGTTFAVHLPVAGPHAPDPGWAIGAAPHALVEEADA